jgi:hypothetical protein
MLRVFERLALCDHASASAFVPVGFEFVPGEAFPTLRNALSQGAEFLGNVASLLALVGDRNKTCDRLTTARDCHLLPVLDLIDQGAEPIFRIEQVHRIHRGVSV